MAKFNLVCHSSHFGNRQETFSKETEKGAIRYARRVIRKFQEEIDKQQRGKNKCRSKRHDHKVRGILQKTKVIAIFS